jgi:hypothetical protein
MMKLREMKVQIGAQNQWKRVSGFMQRVFFRDIGDKGYRG